MSKSTHNRKHRLFTLNAPRLRASACIMTAAALLAPMSVSTVALAASFPQGTSSDSRVKTVVYDENDVISLRGHYGYQTTISFATFEKIQNISIGDSVSWQVVPNQAGNLLFIKPVEENAETNMTVITDRRIYNFELSSGFALSPRDNLVTYMLKFIYPDDNVLSFTYDDAAVSSSRSPYAPPSKVDSVGVSATGTPRDLNFDYSFKGEKDVAPTIVFDNGEFTYFRFADMGDHPAIFEVDRDRKESLINYNIDDGYVVVNSIGRQFTLRHGDTEACVFNDSYDDRMSLFAEREAG